MQAKQPNEFKLLIQKYLNGQCSQEEKALVESWLIAELRQDAPTLTKEEILASDLRMQESMQRYLDAGSVKRLSLWPRYAAAVAVLLILGAGIFWFNTKTDNGDPQSIQASTDVLPGRQGATLTLANGKKIRLSDAVNGQLASEAGVVVTKSADGQLLYEVKDPGQDRNKVNVLSTSKGETYQVKLSDGSIVWLNSASSLEYHSSFAGSKERVVKLTGEAFFEVAKDKSRPFIVQAGDQQVQVLGTQFNVNSYKDEPAIATTLVEGSVKVSSDNGQCLIKPGQQVINDGVSMSLQKIDATLVTDWKDGDFNLDEVELKTALRKIARWYDVEVVYDPAIPNDIRVVGLISRKRKLSSVLEVIHSSAQVNFKIDGRKIYVKP